MHGLPQPTSAGRWVFPLPSGFVGCLFALLAGVAGWIAAAPAAQAHGGRFNGPGGKGVPPDTTAPAPPL